MADWARHPAAAHLRLPLFQPKSWSSYTPMMGLGHALGSVPGGGTCPASAVPGHMCSRKAW